MKLRMQEAYTVKMLVISENIYGYFRKTLQRLLDIPWFYKCQGYKEFWMCLNNF